MMKPQVKANPQKHFILANQALRATLSYFTVLYFLCCFYNLPFLYPSVTLTQHLNFNKIRDLSKIPNGVYFQN